VLPSVMAGYPPTWREGLIVRHRRDGDMPTLRRGMRARLLSMVRRGGEGRSLLAPSGSVGAAADRATDRGSTRGSPQVSAQPPGALRQGLARHTYCRGIRWSPRLAWAQAGIYIGPAVGARA
jgi:hypothetical protein